MVLETPLSLPSLLPSASPHLKSKERWLLKNAQILPFSVWLFLGVQSYGRLQLTLLLTTLSSAFGSAFQYGYNIAVVNTPPKVGTRRAGQQLTRVMGGSQRPSLSMEVFKSFYNETYFERHETFMDEKLILLLWSCTVSMFPLGGLLGSLIVGLLVDRCGSPDSTDKGECTGQVSREGKACTGLRVKPGGVPFCQPHSFGFTVTLGVRCQARQFAGVTGRPSNENAPASNPTAPELSDLFLIHCDSSPVQNPSQRQARGAPEPLLQIGLGPRAQSQADEWILKAAGYARHKQELVSGERPQPPRTAALWAHCLCRKGTLLINDIFAIIPAILMGVSKVAKAFELIIFSRVVLGVCAGISYSALPMYLGELAPKNLRGMLGTMTEVFVIVGVFLAQIFSLQAILGNSAGWPVLLALTGVPALLQLLSLPFFPESPRYSLIQKGDEARARQALRRLRGHADIEAELEDMHAEARAERAEGHLSVLRLCALRPQRWQLLSIIVLMAGQQLSGINAINYYADTIYASAGVEAADSQYVTVGAGVVNIVVTVISVSEQEASFLLEGFWPGVQGANTQKVWNRPEQGRVVVKSVNVRPRPGEQPLSHMRAAGAVLVERLGRRLLLLAGYGICGSACLVLTAVILFQV
ncbi:hypothetical protein P7K49_015386 [Saguinus oedipus]|uniref:Major facilitator superfamily (MFS) profile domain-containing protein n=1 Tax=Saguinus oedipus TaxID=9490 RepID=A0ABQ9V940_SAGOE|nr:hypothetical protein P7K49_015386 [Saguinus oedipus]